jgi:hypothetical protein
LGIRTSGTERPIRRPKDEEKQKATYSGKKKRHTNKHVTITHPKTQRILAVSEEALGTKHDKKLFDEMELSCTTPIPVLGESGFQGLEVGQAVVTTPIKGKPTKKGEPKSELSVEQKEYHRALSKERMSIEPSLAGFKRNRSVSEVLRNTRVGMSDALALVAMGLHNLPVSTRQAYQF